MNEFKPPTALKLEGNLPENWRRFKQAYDIFMIASGHETKEERIRTSMLLNFIGEEAVEVFNTFHFDEEADKEKLDIVVQKFKDYCEPRKNLTFERNKFFTHNQGSEGFQEYLTELKKRASSCEFGDLTNSIIKDRIVCGIKNSALKERLLRVTDLTLDKAVQICQVSEVTGIQMQELQGDATVHAIRNYQKPNTRPNYNRGLHRDVNAAQGVVSQRMKNQQGLRDTRAGNQCRFCGRFHPPRSCPAYGKQCNACHQYNHFAKQCMKKKTYPSKDNTSSKGNLKVANLESDEYFIGSINVTTQNRNEWNETLKINNCNVKFKLDTGAQVNVIPRNIFESIHENEKVEATNVRIIGYSGSTVPVVGKAQLECIVKGRTEDLIFYVVDVKAEPILGKVDCERLELVKRVHELANEYQQVLSEFTDVFTGVGCLEKPYDIKVDPKVEPVRNAPRRVPEAIKDRLKEELDRMIKDGIISELNEPTEWLHNPVIVEKPNGKLRVCLDPRGLNKAIIRDPYIIPTLPEISSKLKGSQYFTILDAQNGFWQILLTEESSKLCAFTTPFGSFKFLRLPFGVSSAPELFQRVVNEHFGDIPGVDNYFDDIIITGRNKAEHDERLRAALQRARERNFKLNLDKCQFGLKKVKFVGHYLTKDGIEVDPSKTAAIVQMKVPESRKELERFLGMVTYLAKFIPNLSDETAPLRELQKKEILWHWTEEHTKAFEKLKQIVTSPPVLQYYDATLPIKLSVDASKDGIGAVLMQNDLPVCYASRALTNSEKNYAQIEKEMLAIVYGMERFHQFVYGRQVLVESDHKPLEVILKKPLGQAPPRLQRFMLRLQKYQLVVEYKPGKELLTADALSRAFLELTEIQDDEKIEIHELNIAVQSQEKMARESIPMSNKTWEKFKQATKEDQELQDLSKLILEGWPNLQSQVPEHMKPYWNFREEVNQQGSILFKGCKIIVPRSLRPEMLNRLHETHLGLEKTKANAKENLFWLSMNKDIENRVKGCAVCIKNQRSNIKEPLLSHEVPSRPWEKIGTDLYEWNGKQYLIVVDYYSKYIETALLEKTRSEDVKLKSIFARHGIPDTLISDNGPQFASREFSNFATDWEIEHITSSPYHPKSNGLVERMVQNVKNMLKKTSDPYLGLLYLRNTPFQDLGVSPAQLLMGRKLKSRIPVSASSLKPETVDHDTVRQNLKQRQERQQYYYNRNAHPLPILKPGESVCYQHNGKWEKAVVKQTTSAPRSYVVKTNRGELRRNRVHLRKNIAEDAVQLDYDDEEEMIRQECLNPELQNVPFVPEDKSRPKVTRSGRVIRKPARYCD